MIYTIDQESKKPTGLLGDRRHLSWSNKKCLPRQRYVAPAPALIFHLAFVCRCYYGLTAPQERPLDEVIAAWSRKHFSCFCNRVDPVSLLFERSTHGKDIRRTKHDYRFSQNQHFGGLVWCMSCGGLDTYWIVPRDVVTTFWQSSKVGKLVFSDMGLDLILK